MTTKEKIEAINSKYNQNYQINESGRVFTIFMRKKQWHKIDDVVNRWAIVEKERNANSNVSKVVNFLESNNAVLVSESVYGSLYYIYKGYKIRVSNHDWTSEKHSSPDFNLCSYEENGHIDMINIIKGL